MKRTALLFLTLAVSLSALAQTYYSQQAHRHRKRPVEQFHPRYCNRQARLCLDSNGERRQPRGRQHRHHFPQSGQGQWARTHHRQ